jgi:hypothetical protein
MPKGYYAGGVEALHPTSTNTVDRSSSIFGLPVVLRKLSTSTVDSYSIGSHLLLQLKY